MTHQVRNVPVPIPQSTTTPETNKELTPKGPRL